MYSFLAFLSAVLALAATGRVLLLPSEHPAGVLLCGLPTLAMAASVWSARYLGPRPWTRVAWWVMLLAGWIAVTLLAWGRWEAPGAHTDERQVLLLGFGGAALAAAWIAARLREFPARRTWLQASMATWLIVLVGWAAHAGYAMRVDALGRQAEARWAAIGRPMPVMDRGMRAAPANSALPVLASVLKSEVNANIYKPAQLLSPGTGPRVPEEALAILARPLPPRDTLEPDPTPRPELDARRVRLDNAYAALLAGESPRWAADPRDGFTMRVPNFLGLRMLAQLITADATRRLEQGDRDGAARALAAGLHATGRLRENPTLVAVMVHVATESLLRRPMVWLAAEPGALEKLQADAAEWRKSLARAMEFEGWTFAQFARGNATLEGAFGRRRPWLPSWAEGVTGLEWRKECWASALAQAESLAILGDPNTLHLDDLGEAACEQVVERSGSNYLANFS